MILSLSIRLRLTLWYFLAVAITMFSIGGICLMMVHNAINNLEDNELQQRVRSVKRFIESRPEQETTAQLGDEMKDAFEDSHGNKWLQVIDEHGEWLYRSKHVAAVYPTLALPQNIAGEGKYFIYTTEALAVRALIEPITVRGTRYTVQTGITLNKPLDILSNFRSQIFLLTTLGLIVSSIAGYFMSRKALSPIAAIAHEAQRINDRNLHSRLPVPPARDEISDLSRTLNQMLERINNAFASVRTFTGNASHELRTPISLMRTEIEVALLSPRDSDEYRAILRRLLDETVRMTNLVENLLSLARADGGAEIITLTPVKVEEIFHQSTCVWDIAMHNAGIQLNVIMPDAGISVLCDASSIQRLLSILLENASKFSPEGGSVELRSRVTESSVIFSVQDTGIGITPEDLPRIFDRFYRAAPINVTSPVGSGLGLSLAKWIAERHSTELKVESMPGKGSTFSFELKRAS